MRTYHRALSLPLLLFSSQSSWLSLLRIVLPRAKRISSRCQRPAKSDCFQAVELFSLARRSPWCHSESACLPQEGESSPRARSRTWNRSCAGLCRPGIQSLLCCAFPDRMVLSHALSCAHVQDNEHDTNLNRPPATHHAAHGRAVLACHARSRPPRRRHFRPRRALDAYLLPPVVPGAPAAAPQRHLLPHARGSGTQRLSSLLALPPQRNLRPCCAGSARRGPSCAIHRRRPDARPTRRDARRDAIHFAPSLSPSHGSEAPRTRRSASPQSL